MLIQGETGTGKTALARWLHEQGRAPQPRIGGGELLGHCRKRWPNPNCSATSAARSPTPAPRAWACSRRRNGGTLFLDELPSLSLALQAKVLTAIEDRKIRRVGGNKAIPVDARIIAATQRDLKELAAEGTFREDSVPPA